ncbi:hypothetical protein TRIUR3_15476 [Triticum urartu]|uniref:Uncharacterized protein n=1 Tax=Triticum urartu TaxID=4572 RepID=M8ACY9_TRIUA|nr:hypothetical protein TRIUR3_15476 [Triticum urartu]
MASIVVIGLVLLLDILAFVLAIGAERRRSTASGSRILIDWGNWVQAQLGEAEPGGRRPEASGSRILIDWGNWVQAQLGEAEPGGRRYCVYDTDASTWYGVSALALLLGGKAVAMAASRCSPPPRCFCCGRALSPGRWRFFSGLFFVLCWRVTLPGVMVASAAVGPTKVDAAVQL